MVRLEELLDLVDKSFPKKPIPNIFFCPDYENAPQRDIIEDLSIKIANRSWNDVTILDWRMIGVSPSVARVYIEPGTFLYYLPSILIGALESTEYIDFALESIVPYNKERL